MSRSYRNPTERFFTSLFFLYILALGINFQFANRIGMIQSDLGSPSKTISLCFLLAIPFIGRGLLRFLGDSKLLKVFLMWVVLSTSISFFLTLGTNDLVPFSNVARTVEQMGGIIVGLILGYYALVVTHLKADVLVKYINYSIVLVIFGVAFQLANTGASIPRLHGLSGEPKGLALFLVPFIIATVAFSRNRFQRNSVVCLTVIGLLLTQSATGIIALVLSIVVYVHAIGALKTRSLAISFCTLSILFLTIAVVPELREMTVGRIVAYSSGEYTRGVQMPFTLPLLGTITVEANDFPVAMLLKDNPHFLVTGVGLGQESILSFHYIARFGNIGFLDQDYSGYITPNMALLANISNYGVVAVVLIARYLILLSKRLHSRLIGVDKFIFYFFFTHLFISLLVFRTIIPISMSLFVTIGIANWYTDADDR